jgi:hypothetical protein
MTEKGRKRPFLIKSVIKNKTGEGGGTELPVMGSAPDRSDRGAARAHDWNTPGVQAGRCQSGMSEPRESREDGFRKIR